MNKKAPLARGLAVATLRQLRLDYLDYEQALGKMLVGIGLAPNTAASVPPLVAKTSLLASPLLQVQAPVIGL